MSEETKTRRIFVSVRLRDNTVNERRLRVTDEQMNELQNHLIESGNVRAFDIYEPIGRHHKSFAEDFEPEGLLAALDELDPNFTPTGIVEAMKTAVDVFPEEPGWSKERRKQKDPSIMLTEEEVGEIRARPVQDSGDIRHHDFYIARS